MSFALVKECEMKKMKKMKKRPRSLRGTNGDILREVVGGGGHWDFPRTTRAVNAPRAGGSFMSTRKHTHTKYTNTHTRQS